MNYLISEDAFNRIEAVRAQLSFVTGLVSNSSESLGLVLAQDLIAFLDAQRDGLTHAVADARTVADAVRGDGLLEQSEAHSMLRAMRCARDRLHAQVEAALKMGAKDWARALRIAADPEGSASADDLNGIAFRLSAAAKVDHEMQDAVEAWNAVASRRVTKRASPEQPGAPRSDKVRRRAALAGASDVSAPQAEPNLGQAKPRKRASLTVPA